MGPFALLSCGILLSSITRAITIPPAPVWPSGHCTDKSLTIPSWIIIDYKVSAGTATFKVNNRASESSEALFECSPGKKQCRNSAAASQISATWADGANGNKMIMLSESWVCKDERQEVSFSATGNSTITSCAGSDCTSPITFLAPGSLTSPIPLTPFQPSPPSGYSDTTCAEVGKKQWTVSSVNYKNYAKSQCKEWYYQDSFCHDGPPSGALLSGQYLNLVVSNNVISHNVSCKFTPYASSRNLPSPFRCTGGNFNEITLDITFSGVAPNFMLKVEELWYCLEDPMKNVKPTAIVASGSVAIPMTCESHIGYTGTPDDIVTFCTDSVSHTIDAVQVDKKSLDPYSLVTAYPVHGGCTFDSIINPTFYYRKMLFQTNPDSVTLKRLTAGMNGPGFKDYFFYDSKPISGSGINTVYSCNDYNDGKPAEQHYKCTYSLNPSTFQFNQTKVWECSDKDIKQPLYFEGSGTFDWSKNPNSQCTKAENMLYCYWNGDQANFEPGIPYAIPKVTVSLVNVQPPKRLKREMDGILKVMRN